MQFKKRLEQSAREREQRLRNKPRFHFPSALPITAKRHEIVRAIKNHRVLIISGETGCGKSTQLPKMCLEAGRGIAGKIACTQPRRIAAITIAHRIAEELGESVGRSVGYKIRFQDRTPREAYIKVMTDGMLLAETQSDRRLYEYDTLIIDEAHERSLNIDFLLGIARTFLDVRPELKIIITSATLDTEKFSRAFGDAPVIHVGGRMYPVEVEYMPPESFGRDAEDADYVDLAVRAVERLKSRKQRGDILVFMPTEQDILEACERLEGKHYPATTILPLYARLPAGQQGRVYAVSGAKIVVATNVAETSLTIPGIRYVIDTGLARVAQYQPGTRVNSLPISPISQASADQRKGRCGRVQEGLCIRLYSEKDYEERPTFTPPEILRSNLAEVILRMIDLGLGHPSQFPFVDLPNPKNIKDGYETLLELGAATGSGREYELTPAGRKMARMPLDPRISRLLLEAEKEDCLREVAIIASALSIRDPRERPPDKAGLADQAQASFAHPDSDFLTLLNIWDRFYGGENAASKSRLRKFCHENYLSFARMREWKFVH
ncbi:MAG: ATP-dependent RNA helicase HrpA, partial [Acidobacteriota bacterium]